MPKGKEKAVTNADLVKAIKQNKPAAVSKLLKAGGDPNAMTQPLNSKPDDPYREPLLISAAQVLASGIMLTTLIKAKAEVDKRDSVGGTALMAAATVGEVDSLRVLLAAGAIIDNVTLQNETALFHACGHGQPECARFLLEQKADVELGSAAKVTPLMIATQNGHQKAVQALLDFGAKLDAVDAYGNSALGMADHHLDYDTKKWVRPEIEKKLKELALDKEVDAKGSNVEPKASASADVQLQQPSSASEAHAHEPWHEHREQPSSSEEERIVDVTDEGRGAAPERYCSTYVRHYS